MDYKDLNKITEDDVLGRWQVESRLTNQKCVSNAFSSAEVIQIEDKYYKSINGKVISGEWKVVRETEIIYNPQLKFFINNQQAANAIITKLVKIIEHNKLVHRLTLYFNDGLELVLEKQIAY